MQEMSPEIAVEDDVETPEENEMEESLSAGHNRGDHPHNAPASPLQPEVRPQAKFKPCQHVVGHFACSRRCAMHYSTLHCDPAYC